jgi:hypothetical protein
VGLLDLRAAVFIPDHYCGVLKRDQLPTLEVVHLFAHRLRAFHVLEREHNQ